MKHSVSYILSIPQSDLTEKNNPKTAPRSRFVFSEGTGFEPVRDFSHTLSKRAP